MGQSLSTSVPSPDLNISKTNLFCYGYVDGYGDGNGNDSSSDNFGYRRNSIDEIPDECLASILHFVDAVDRKNCSLVCRRWLRVEGESRQRLSLNAEAKLLDVVPSLFTRFDSVTKIALRCNRKSISINDDALILISLRCKNLTRLKLRGCREITEIGMLGLARNCKNLKKLSVVSCLFGVKGIHAVVDNSNVIEELSVKRLRGVNDDGGELLCGGGGSSLKSICLKELVNGSSFAPLIIGSRKLQTLKLIRCIGDWDTTLTSVGKLSSGLIEIHLEKIQVSDVGLVGVSKCLKLETLHLVKTPECSDVGLIVVAEHCKMLKKLHINGWRTNRIGDDSLISVARNCPNLQELVLIAMFPTSLSLGAIASYCQGLERFALCGIVTFSDADIECIASKCVALRKLCIKGCPVSNVGIAAFASGCPNLVKLKVRKCVKVTGEVGEWLRMRRSSLAVNFDHNQVEALDGSGSDVGVQETTMAFPPNDNEVTLIDDSPSTSNNNNNNNNRLFRTKFGFFAGRNFVPCAFRRVPVRMGLGNLYRRRVRVFTMAIVVYLDYKSVQQKEKWVSKSKQTAMWEKAHERNAKRILKLIIEMEGLWVKLGQYMSTRADVLPPAYINNLKQLQDSLPPRPLEEVYGTIQKEFGKSMDELFLDFVNEPLATASIAQVHRATLLNGQDVVVKVQHDGIKTVILEDLKNAKSIVDWIAWAEPQYNFNPMIDEWCKEAPKELDFNLEAENTRTVEKNLGCRNQHDGNLNPNRVDVLIPDVIQATEKVLILEYMDGIRLNDLESLEAYGVDKQKIVEEITRAYAHQIYIDGFFNGDPHPGNFLVSKESPHRPILLDFGLTKILSSTIKQALAKMFLSSVEGDHVALLSAFAEMGLKLRLDIPEQAMEVTAIFFRATTPAKESMETMKSLDDKRKNNMKIIQEKMNLNQKEMKHFNPVDAFPGDIVIFGRVLNLLRGLSATMNVTIVYMDIMRPFAESVLSGFISRGPSVNDGWVFNSPVHSDVESRLRKLLIELGNNDKILGIQVCAYKDGEVIIDTAAGVLGKYDPRPVKPDSLFPVFSVTKGITAGMVHWLVDNGKLNLEENVANIWPSFGSNGKEVIKVHHVLNHTSGLHSAMADMSQENPLLILDWDECLKRICSSAPETEPGKVQSYHYLSFGWLCGGIIEHASGKKFQEILEESIVRPLQIEGELYVGIPPGVESRLAALTVDTDDLNKLVAIGNRPDLPFTFQPQQIAQLATTLPPLFNTLYARRAIIPAANGHLSARALACYYAALADGGKIPPPHSSSFKPILGSHPHIPKLSSQKTPKKRKCMGRAVASLPAINKSYEKVSSKEDSEITEGGKNSRDSSGSDDAGSSNVDSNPRTHVSGKVYRNPRIVDEFLGTGEYENLTLPGGGFGLGFKRFSSKDGSTIAFGHSGMGGSTGFCDVTNRFSIAVTLNKMSFGGVTGKIVQLVCSELNIPVPDDFLRYAVQQQGDAIQRPMIN